jgi:hypothetical protein
MNDKISASKKIMLDNSAEVMQRTEVSLPHPVNPRLEHGILGKADEAGELITLLKAAKFYKRPIDMVNLKEELGDDWWYFTLLIDEIANIEERTREQVFDEILTMNRMKLEARYKDNQYSDEQANERDLDKERAALEGAVDTSDPPPGIYTVECVKRDKGFSLAGRIINGPHAGKLIIMNYLPDPSVGAEDGEKESSQEEKS